MKKKLAASLLLTAAVAVGAFASNGALSAGPGNWPDHHTTVAAPGNWPDSVSLLAGPGNWPDAIGHLAL